MLLPTATAAILGQILTLSLKHHCPSGDFCGQGNSDVLQS